MEEVPSFFSNFPAPSSQLTDFVWQEAGRRWLSPFPLAVAHPSLPSLSFPHPYILPTLPLLRDPYLFTSINIPSTTSCHLPWPSRTHHGRSLRFFSIIHPSSFRICCCLPQPPHLSWSKAVRQTCLRPTRQNDCNIFPLAFAPRTTLASSMTTFWCPWSSLLPALAPAFLGPWSIDAILASGNSAKLPLPV